MPTARSRSENDDFRFVGSNVNTPTSRRKAFSISYYSNRENGQIVKRESPLSLHLSEYVGLSKRPNNDYVYCSNETVAYRCQTWNLVSNPAYARAYARFKEQASIPAAEVLLNVVEGRKALEMLGKRLFQLSEFARALRKGRLGDAWNFMSLNPDLSLREMKSGRVEDSRFVSGRRRQRAADIQNEKRRILRDVGNVVLEWRYGWSPLMNDIQNAMSVLSKDYSGSPLPLKGRCTRRFSEVLYTFTDGATIPVKGTFTEKVTVKGRIRVNNPNVLLANQLGVLNLAGVVWEAIPFSFLVDWFLSVGDFLKSLTDFAGLELIDGSITGSLVGISEIPGYVLPSWTSPAGPFKLDRKARVCHATRRIRQTGFASLPRPPLVVGTGLSPGRAINAVALLLQQLPGRTKVGR